MSYRRHKRKRPKAEESNGHPDPALILVPPHGVMQIWPVVEPLIKQGATNGDRTLNELVDQCLHEESQLWVIFSDRIEAAGVTTIVRTQKGPVLQIDSFAGDEMQRWWNTQDDLWTWAKSKGCVMARVSGRRGWAKALESKGFELRYFICEKDL